MLQNQLSAKTRSIISGLAAFLIYGSWAYFANSDHTHFIASKAALTQGSYSFMVTLTLSLLMETIFSLLDKPRLRFATTFISSSLLLYFTSWLINKLLGTPNILATIAPGTSIGTVYIFIYTLNLHRQTTKAQQKTY